MRIDPPPSLAVPKGTIPTDTAARRATAGPARRDGRVPRVAGDAEERAGRVGPGAELRGGGLADRDGTGGAEAADVQRVGRLRRAVGEPARPARRRHARAVLQVLHAERHAGERSELGRRRARRRRRRGPRPAPCSASRCTKALRRSLCSSTAARQARTSSSADCVPVRTRSAASMTVGTSGTPTVYRFRSGPGWGWSRPSVRWKSLTSCPDRRSKEPHGVVGGNRSGPDPDEVVMPQPLPAPPRARFGAGA